MMGGTMASGSGSGPGPGFGSRLGRAMPAPLRLVHIAVTMLLLEMVLRMVLRMMLRMVLRMVLRMMLRLRMVLRMVLRIMLRLRMVLRMMLRMMLRLRMVLRMMLLGVSMCRGLVPNPSPGLVTGGISIMGTSVRRLARPEGGRRILSWWVGRRPLPKRVYPLRYRLWGTCIYIEPWRICKVSASPG